MPKLSSNVKAANKNSISNKTPVKEVVQEVIVDSGSESESDASSLSDSDEDQLDEESEHESEKESEHESEKEAALKEKKEKPKKVTHKELTTELISNEEKIQELESKLVEHENFIKGINKEQNALRRLNVRLIKQLDKAHDEDVTRARKEKKKRNITQNSGILKNKPIPPVLIKFLGIKSDITELPRTKVMSLLNNKFKELELKKGQDTFLDKATAKIFGKEEGYKIEFKYFQTFLKNVYEEAELKSTEVSL